MANHFLDLTNDSDTYKCIIECKRKILFAVWTVY